MSQSKSYVNTVLPAKHSAFKRGDVLIFVVFPTLLILGFLLFLWWRKTSADPNLRLVAQVTDDISVELVAVASQNQANGGPTMWWKPNGFSASEVKEKAAGKTFGGSDPHFHVLYHFKDQRPGKNAVVTGAGGSGAPLRKLAIAAAGSTLLLAPTQSPISGAQ